LFRGGALQTIHPVTFMNRLAKTPLLLLFLAVSLCVHGISGRVHAAAVGINGYTNAFSALPPAADWSTGSISGGPGDITSAAALDNAVQLQNASSISGQLGTDVRNPPDFSVNALWSSTGEYIQTRPTGPAATLLMCTLVNALDGDANAVTISYDFAKVAMLAEEVEGHRVYWSLTGTPGSWTVIPALSSANPGRVTATVNLAWPQGGTLYVLWADENGSPSPDTANQIDNFFASANPARQTPAEITSQPEDSTVAELFSATFNVVVSGNPQPTLQWHRNGVVIPGATNTSYTIASALLSDHGARFTVTAANTASNVNYSVTSREAVLSVTADTTPPVLLGASAASLTSVILSFSEPILEETATNPENYAISSAAGALVISNAVLAVGGTNVMLNTSPQTENVPYTVTVNGLRDRSDAANLIAANSTATFMAQSLVVASIGNATPAATVTGAGTGVNVTGGGNDIGGSNDQFQFVYQQHSGNFDVKVRVESLSLTDAWAKAGLMARETLQANSRHATVVATPNISGSFFQYRTTIGGGTASVGTFPVNYPNTWLRLRRTANTFTAFASLDGEIWSQLGSVTITMPSTVYLGYAVSSRTNGVATTAAFRDYGTVIGGTIGGVIFPREPTGPSSRNTALVISEIMYRPRAVPGITNSLEFVEIFNTQQMPEDISGFRIAGSIAYTFPPNTIIQPGEFIVIAKDPAFLQSHYGISGVHGPFSSTLPDDGGRVRLRNRQGAVLLEVNYEGATPWPAAANGAGHSLVLTHPSWGEDNFKGWGPSSFIGGSPGAMDPMSTDAINSVVINEFLANTEDPNDDFVEIYNYSTRAVDISGAWLSDNPSTNKFRIPNETILPPQGFMVFYPPQLGFALGATGEAIYLVNSNQTRVVDAHIFEAQALGVSSGRYPDGAPWFHELVSTTPGAANSPLLFREIVINELMYNPISGLDEDEYIELYNRSSNAVDVSNWRFTAGVNYTIPPGTVIPADGYLVVAKDKQRLFENYPQLNDGNTVGNYGGTLANGGERVALARPEYRLSTNNNVVITNVIYTLVNEVTYDDGGRWGQWADRGGSSLELIDPRSDNRLASNWADSDERAKSEWIHFEHTGVLDLGRGDRTGTQSELQVMILGGGECLVDNLEVFRPGGANLVPNGTFENGLTGWVIQGNHIDSGLAQQGFESSRSLHLRAPSGGDNGPNRAKIIIPTALNSGNATIRGKARWLHGHTNVLLRLYGNYLEVVASMPVPKNLGSPGLPNSRRVANAGPAIHSVTHNPVLPAANQPVVVTARVHDPDGVAQVQLRYRIDPGTTLLAIPMRDDGTGGDAIAGDGIYTATIPGQSSGALVAFRIVATDDFTPPATTMFPDDAPARECLIRFGETPQFGNVGVYRLWMTAANINEWSNRAKLSNMPLDGTFVYGNFRVIYNAAARYRGSPWIRPGYNTPTGRWCAYIMVVPDDEEFLGTTEINLDSLEPGSRDSTQLREITSFWMADQLNIPFSYQRFVHLVINGVDNQSRGVPVFADVQQPDSKYMQSWFPNGDRGEIFKIDDWFEFTDGSNPGKEGWNENGRLIQYLSGGQKKKARYRWSWEKKSNRGLDDDYTRLFDLVDTVTAPDTVYVQAVESAINVENWSTAIALRHIIGDWDGWGYNRGKNQFIYLPNGGKWEMLLWDLDFSLGCTSGHGPTHNVFEVEGGETSSARMFGTTPTSGGHPHFKRVYYRALQRAVDGPLLAERVVPFLEGQYNGLLANNINPVSPFVGSGQQGISIPEWIRQRRNYLIGIIPNVQFTVTGTNNITTANNLVTLSGTAPVLVKTVKVNGNAYPVTWSFTGGNQGNPTTWTTRLPVEGGINDLVIEGYDIDDNLIPGASRSVTVNFTGQSALPQESIVFSEIMYNPAQPNASFIEIHNTATNFSFDLSSWRINGLSYTFPAGSILTNGQYLVLAKDRAGFSAAYGATVPVYDVFPGTLDIDGETLTLIKPGATPEANQTIAKVRYEAVAPWPTAADGTGPSLQLIDPTQDISRVGNWSDGSGWRYFSFTGTPGGTNLMFFLSAAGEVHIDDLTLVTGTAAGVGENLIRNSGFEEEFSGPWVATGSHSTSHASAEEKRSGDRSLKIVATGPGTLTSLVSQHIPEMVPTQVHTLSFWYLPNPLGANLTARFGSGFRPTLDTRPTQATPGRANTTFASLPPFPPLWLNEVQAVNVNGILDSAGQRDPWVELYNSGDEPISLEGYYLTDNYAAPYKWPFPAGASIAPGQFRIVFVDGHPAQSSAAEWHTSFRLSPGTGSIGLVRDYNGESIVIDYLNYTNLEDGDSYGAYPDGQPFTRQIFQIATPGAANDPAAAAVPVFINEWMASNTRTIVDPMDGRFDDWFELYNAGANAVDLSGYYLTDNLNNPTKWRVPNGTVIPGRGFLLVWADNQTSQNNNPHGHLHTNFSLDRVGEAIGLFGPDGVTAIDTVVFGEQTSDVSQGRFPDGSARIEFMIQPTPGAPNVLDGAGPPPEFSGVTRAENGQVTLTWTGIAGKSYRVLYKNDLIEPEWHRFSPDAVIVAGGASVSFQDDSAGVAQRFYLVEQID
jgi:hypothetical protein